MQLLDHDPSVDPTADVRGPFTLALGLPIAPKASKEPAVSISAKAAGAIESSSFAARHVALPLSEYLNELYKRKNCSSPRREIVHLGSRAFQNALEAIMDKIGHEDLMIDSYKDELGGLGEVVEGEDTRTSANRKEFENRLAKAEASKASVYEFHGSAESQLRPSNLRKNGLSLSSIMGSSTRTFSEATLFVSVRFDLSH